MQILVFVKPDLFSNEPFQTELTIYYLMMKRCSELTSHSVFAALLLNATTTLIIKCNMLKTK